MCVFSPAAQQQSLQLSGRIGSTTPREDFFFFQLRGVQCSIFTQQKEMHHEKVGYKPAAGYGEGGITIAAKSSDAKGEKKGGLEFKGPSEMTAAFNAALLIKGPAHWPAQGCTLLI